MNPADKCTVLASFIRHNDQHRNMHDATEFSTFTFVSLQKKKPLSQTPENINSAHTVLWTRVNLTCQPVRVTLNHYKKDVYFD